ncbi:MAG: MSMEG_4193 family putative phosphomutase [Actinomycetota bacterium]
MTLLLLIRHGLTSATGTRLVGWTPGIRLSEEGRAQAQRVRDRLEGTRIDAIYSSPLDRCRETAKPLAADRTLPVRVRKDLGEIGYGAWTDRSLRQLAKTKLWPRVQQVPSRVRFPQGESFGEAHARIVGALDAIAAEHPSEVVAAFSHADAIKLALAELAGMHLDMFQRIVIDPASVSAVALGDGVPRLVRVNDLGTLDALAPRKRGGTRQR